MIKGNYYHVPLISGYCSLESLFIDKYLEKCGRQPSPVNVEGLIPTSLRHKLGTKEKQNAAHKIMEFFLGEEDINDENKMNLVLVRTKEWRVWDFLKLDIFTVAVRWGFLLWHPCQRKSSRHIINSTCLFVPFRYGWKAQPHEKGVEHNMCR